ncbi:glycosyltransferase family 1 protein [Janthinobacterium sp.]|uniref:glycosyltransferase family 4 protein n=1 Tax=Janthinobacterium sp. TaxID=1871054 RepID=UPI00293D43C4|nr:glycosyltransferase family 1 protein [Janthinobacterium sp.]
MQLFAEMLKEGYEARGHQVLMWEPEPRLHRHFAGGRLAKWAGYVDQYLLFPRRVRQLLVRQSADTLFVLCDQALGPWAPLVKHRPHVVHCHDLLALRSALGELEGYRTSFTGRIYQRYIRRGFEQARHFISISEATKSDLQRCSAVRPLTSARVYNGLNYPYAPLPPEQAQQILAAAGLPVEARGMLLNLGSNSWYKNRLGLLHLYARYAASVADPLPLWCVGPPPNAAMQAALEQVPAQGKVLFFQGLDNLTLQAAYSHARAFLFPSNAEGFGWPLLEAQACGCPVLTTDAAPMNEVAGPAARYVAPLGARDDLAAWAGAAARTLTELLALEPAQRTALGEQGRAWAAGFGADAAIDGYLEVYRSVLAAPASVAGGAA